jgi:hypothetical protein
VAYEKCPSNLHFAVLAFICQLSHYCGKKIHDRISKVALAEKSTQTLVAARPAPHFVQQYRCEQIYLTLQ